MGIPWRSPASLAESHPSTQGVYDPRSVEQLDSCRNPQVTSRDCFERDVKITRGQESAYARRPRCLETL